MKKIKFPIIAILVLIFLNACTSVKEGLAGNKKKTSDEFLVEKKTPLVFPPNYGELPEPGAKKNENGTSTKVDNSSIEELIGQSSSTDINKGNNTSSSSIEESIIEKINE
jgi:hypothetical protein